LVQLLHGLISYIIKRPLLRRLLLLNNAFNLGIEESCLVLGYLIIDVLESRCPELPLSSLRLVIHLIELNRTSLTEVAKWLFRRSLRDLSWGGNLLKLIMIMIIYINELRVRYWFLYDGWPIAHLDSINRRGNINSAQGLIIDGWDFHLLFFPKPLLRGNLVVHWFHRNV
jgi:hypothetical protein